MQKAVKAALACGQLLLAEKDWFDRTLGRKHKDGDGSLVPAQPWASYSDATYGKSIPPAEVTRYMKLARRHEGQGEFQFGDPRGANVIRSGILALELFPAKVHEPIPEDARMPSVASHLAAVNKLASWWRQMSAKYRAHKLPDAIRDQLVRDLAPIIEMVDVLRSGEAKDVINRAGVTPRHPR